MSYHDTNLHRSNNTAALRQFTGALDPRALLARLAYAFKVRAERRRLMQLDDRMLKDIGLSRGEAYRESSRAFSDLPASLGRRVRG